MHILRLVVETTTQLTTWRTTARPTTTTAKPPPLLLTLIGCDLLLGMIRNHKLEVTVMFRCVVNDKDPTHTVSQRN